MNSKEGFTLIELVIVLAIIAIIVAIAVPNAKLAIDRADSSRCKSNLHALMVGLALYKVDFNVFPYADGRAGNDASPLQSDFGNGPAANGYWDGVPWLIADLGYITDREIFYCPTMVKRNVSRKPWLRYAYNYSTMHNGGSTGGSDDIEKKDVNVWLARCLWITTDGFDPGKALGFPHPGLKKPGENVLFIDGKVEFRERY